MAAQRAEKISESRETRLWQRFLSKPTEKCHEAIWNLYQPLVRNLAERFNHTRGGQFEILELIDAGNVGLLDAIAEFQLESTPFTAYAAPAIRDAIRRSLSVQCFRATYRPLRLIDDTGVAASAQAEQRVQTSDPLSFPRESNLLNLREHLRRFARQLS